MGLQREEGFKNYLEVELTRGQMCSVRYSEESKINDLNWVKQEPNGEESVAH